MIILDTDHIVSLKHENDPHWNTLTTNLVSSADQDFATTAITVEEQTACSLDELRDLAERVGRESTL